MSKPKTLSDASERVQKAAGKLGSSLKKEFIKAAGKLCNAEWKTDLIAYAIFAIVYLLAVVIIVSAFGDPGCAITLPTGRNN